MVVASASLRVTRALLLVTRSYGRSDALVPRSDALVAARTQMVSDNRSFGTFGDPPGVTPMGSEIGPRSPAASPDRNTDVGFHIITNQPQPTVYKTMK